MKVPRLTRSSQPSLKTSASNRAAQPAQPGFHSLRSGLNPLGLQQLVGNRAATRYLEQQPALRVQTRLAVTDLSDPFEREAELVAQGKPAGPGRVQRASAMAGTPVSEDFAQQLGHTSSGSPLPTPTRQQMEARLGTDLSSVRIHTDPQSKQLNQQLRSQAFTHGSQVYFDSSQYHPGSATGDHLLAHELTHVAQQGAAPAGVLQPGGRSPSEISTLLTSLCEKAKQTQLAPKLIEVVNLCLAHLKDNEKFEDNVLDYIGTLINYQMITDASSKQDILNELAGFESDLTEIKLPKDKSAKPQKEELPDPEPDVAPDTEVALEDRPVIKLYMEQGVAGPLNQVILFSGQFSTCSPIVMLNGTTGMGGLFHFGAKSLKDQSASLLQIFDHVKPEVIYLFTGADKLVEDQRTLAKFFREERPGVEIENGGAYHGLYITQGEEGSPALFEQSPKEKDVTHDLRKAHKVKLPVNCQFFGKSKVADYWL